MRGFTCKNSLNCIPPSRPHPRTPPSPVTDMDGTLTQPRKADYEEMRQLLDIPVGDVFTVLESWDDGDAIKRSMDIILELEEKVGRPPACTCLGLGTADSGACP